MNKNNIYQFLSSKGLILIILLAFVIRMSFFISTQPWEKEIINNKIFSPGSDAAGYHQRALSLITNKSFEDFDAFRTPCYPIFIALIYSISSCSIWLVLLIQIFLSLISVWLVYKIASTMFSRKIGLLSALLFSIDIPQALHTVYLLTETLFVFLFLVSVYYLCKSINENRFWSICLSALYLGIATLVRPISFLFPFAVVFFILVLSNLKLKKKLVYSLLFSFIFIITISPWLLRNYSKYGEAKLSSVSGYNLLFYNVVYTEMSKTVTPVDQVNKNFYALAIKQGIDTTDMFSFKNSHIFSNIATNYIKENFIFYCKRHIIGIINMYVGIGTSDITSIFHLKTSKHFEPNGGEGLLTLINNYFKTKYTNELIINFILGFYMLICYVSSLYAILYLIRKKEKYVFLFILIILYFSVLTGIVGTTRYRIPIMPFIYILSAVGIFHFYNKIIAKISSVRN
jgi:4-amino-4-deoxy-L-arabinose transferase-like glycosyltransferase